MNTATGTKQEKLSENEGPDRRRGMKLVTRSDGSTPFRIAMSQELVNSFRDSENSSLIPVLTPLVVDDENSSPKRDIARPGEGMVYSSSVPIAVALTGVALTGVLVGFLLRRGRD